MNTFLRPLNFYPLGAMGNFVDPPTPRVDGLPRPPTTCYIDSGEGFGGGATVPKLDPSGIFASRVALADPPSPAVAWELSPEGCAQTVPVSGISTSSNNAVLKIEPVRLPKTIDLGGRKWIVRDEFHVTLVGHVQTEHLVESIRVMRRGIRQEGLPSNRQIKDLIRSAIADAARDIDFAVSVDGKYRIAEDGDRRTLLVMADVDGAELYYARLNEGLASGLAEAFGEHLPAGFLDSIRIETPPFHITLYSGENGQAIGIHSAERLREVSKDQEPPKPRELRIAIEDGRLASSPKQRKVLVLDYIRRGRLKDGIHIMPDLIDIAPKLLESGLVDFKRDDFDLQGAIRYLTGIFQEVEREIIEEDRSIRAVLGMNEAKDRRFLDEKWYAKEILPRLKTLLTPKPARSPQTEERYQAALRKKLTSQLAERLSIDPDRLYDDFIADPAKYNLAFRKTDDHPIKAVLYRHRPDGGFTRFPGLSNYEGPIVDSPPDFVNNPIRADLEYVGRDQLPAVKGGVIVDGNFGYDDNGEVRRPADKIIIDHHDQFDTKSHDTATIMAIDFLQDPRKAALLEQPEFLDETGRLVVMTNNLDTDSVFSTWVMIHRGEGARIQKIKEILRAASKCGDFLLGNGPGEYGASARDYSYIVTNYLAACEEKIKEARSPREKAELQELLSALERSRAGLLEAETTLEEVRRGNPEWVLNNNELQTLSSTGAAPDGKILKGKEKGEAIKRLKQALTQLEGPSAQAVITLRGQIKELEQRIQQGNKKISSEDKKPLSLQESRTVLNHMVDVVEDIILHPFKYQKFLLQGRNVEEATISETERMYRSGQIEITPDSSDPDLLFIRPGKGEKTIPRPESIDGLYFFLRRREDFNRELIITEEDSYFIMAINTQHIRGLQKYDFNQLIGAFRAKEDAALEGLIAKAEGDLAATGDKEMRDQLEKRVKDLKERKDRNKKGQLWRSRTQMIFSSKTSLSKGEIGEIVKPWLVANKG